MNQELAFWILSGMAVLGALGAVCRRNLVHGVYSLMLFFGALAGIFLLLLAEFIAAVQVLVYIGAVGVLLLFAIMLFGLLRRNLTDMHHNTSNVPRRNRYAPILKSGGGI